MKFEGLDDFFKRADLSEKHEWWVLRIILGVTIIVICGLVAFTTHLFIQFGQIQDPPIKYLVLGLATVLLLVIFLCAFVLYRILQFSVRSYDLRLNGPLTEPTWIRSARSVVRT